MNIDELTYGQVKEILSIFKPNHENNEFIDKKCVVRTYSAGVHIGFVKSINGTECCLKGARRLWKWSGAFTLSEVAIIGIDAENSRMSIEIPSILLTEAIEFIPVSEEALKSFDNCHE